MWQGSAQLEERKIATIAERGAATEQAIKPDKMVACDASLSLFFYSRKPCRPLSYTTWHGSRAGSVDRRRLLFYRMCHSASRDSLLLLSSVCSSFLYISVGVCVPGRVCTPHVNRKRSGEGVRFEKAGKKNRCCFLSTRKGGGRIRRQRRRQKKTGRSFNENSHADEFHRRGMYVP